MSVNGEHKRCLTIYSTTVESIVFVCVIACGPLYIRITLSLGLSKFLVSSTPFLTAELILMKPHTVAVYNVRNCMKEDNPGLIYFKGDNLLCEVGDRYHFIYS